MTCETSEQQQNAMPKLYRFCFKSSYLGGIDYDVSGHWSGRIKLTCVSKHLEKHYRSIYNGDYDNDVRLLYGSIHTHCECNPHLITEICKQFNAWRKQERRAFIVVWRKHSELYGELDAGKCDEYIKATPVWPACFFGGAWHHAETMEKLTK